MRLINMALLMTVSFCFFTSNAEANDQTLIDFDAQAYYGYIGLGDDHYISYEAAAQRAKDEAWADAYAYLDSLDDNGVQYNWVLYWEGLLEPTIDRARYRVTLEFVFEGGGGPVVIF